MLLSCRPTAHQTHASSCQPDPVPDQPDTGTGMPQGEPRPDLHVLAGATRLANIRAIHGAGVAKELLPLEVARGEDLGPQVPLDAPLAFRLTVRGPAADLLLRTCCCGPAAAEPAADGATAAFLAPSCPPQLDMLACAMHASRPHAAAAPACHMQQLCAGVRRQPPSH